MQIILDDELDFSPQFSALKAECGEIEAVGILVAALKIARFFWIEKGEPIPPAVIQGKPYFEKLERAGLIWNTPGGILISWIAPPTAVVHSEAVVHEKGRWTVADAFPQNATLYNIVFNTSKYNVLLNYVDKASTTSSVKKKTTCVGSPKFDHLWNSHCGPLPKVVAMNATREKKALSRWKENPDEAYWVETIKRIAASSFCRGNGNTSWVANFDWLLRPDTHLRVNEGRYDDRKGNGGPRPVNFETEGGL